MYTKEQLGWAKKELQEIMIGDKTRYKTISAQENILLAVEEALITVSMAKTQAYERASKGQATPEFPDKNLQDAMLLLSRNFVSISEIPMQVKNFV